ncbi:hypothetical protein H257_16315 [Aphanomyces astaci]|uniref:Uncharacterized protein n=1 Tax=Aphanomyces astaci TaxID=112090 RepID=W4FKR6_APHAT|nr:hypothetical protein H257_16315 [Aphanomyces astaci]ETV67434.1 hypothetical protein H257_16315 [Aphanomyces astaci]|eukprot:XP_009842993.1 hypothetical protein H257_16315 [Aphanomyces astaci]
MQMVPPAAHFENPFRILLDPGQYFFMQTAGHQEFGILVPYQEGFTLVPFQSQLSLSSRRSKVSALDSRPSVSVLARVRVGPSVPVLVRGVVGTKARSAADASAGLFNGDRVSGRSVGDDTSGDQSAFRFRPGVYTRAPSSSSNGTRPMARGFFRSRRSLSRSPNSGASPTRRRDWRTAVVVSSSVDIFPFFFRASFANTYPAAAAADPGVHAYVNRLLKRIAVSSGLTHELTSHNFRHGDAQHANGHSCLKDKKIAKMLSGRTPTGNVVVPDLSTLDPASCFAVVRVQAVAFQNCVGLAHPNLLIKPAVLEILMAKLLWHLPFLMQSCPHGPAMARLAQAANAAGFTVGNHLAWAASIERPQEAVVETPHQELGTRANDTIAQQQAVIHELVAINKALGLRVAAVEAHVGIGAAPAPPIAMPSHEDEATVPSKRHKAAATSLADLLFEWYARDPPM